jgi:hypothetical protein
VSEFPLAPFHVYAAATEIDSLGFQSQTLFDRGIAGQLDVAACAEHALPGQSEASP